MLSMDIKVEETGRGGHEMTGRDLNVLEYATHMD